MDVRKIPQHELRAKIGYVPQKGVLFSGDIDSNLRYGAPDASEDDLALAAAIAQAQEFIQEKPEGMKTPIAQGGGNVSGGQKQRLSIARALAKKRRSIFLTTASPPLISKRTPLCAAHYRSTPATPPC